MTVQESEKDGKVILIFSLVLIALLTTAFLFSIIALRSVQDENCIKTCKQAGHDRIGAYLDNEYNCICVQGGAKDEVTDWTH